MISPDPKPSVITLNVVLDKFLQPLNEERISTLWLIVFTSYSGCYLISVYLINEDLNLLIFRLYIIFLCPQYLILESLM